MAITGKIYGNFFVALGNEEHDFVGTPDDIQVLGTTSTYTPDQDTHDYLNDITNEVAVAGGYTRKSLTGESWAYDGGTNKLKFDANDVQWTTATFTVRTFVVFNNTGGGADASRGLICYQQSDADITGGGGNFDLVWNASGIVEITVA